MVKLVRVVLHLEVDDHRAAELCRAAREAGIDINLGLVVELVDIAWHRGDLPATAMLELDLTEAGDALVALRAAEDAGRAPPVLTEFKLDLTQAFYAAQLELMKAHQRTP